MPGFVAGEVVRVGWVELERREVEVARMRVRIVAGDAVRIDELIRWRCERRGGGEQRHNQNA